MEKSRPSWMFNCLVLLTFLYGNHAKKTANLNFCDIVCVNNIYKHYCGDARCTTGASDYVQIFALCTDTCTAAIAGEAMTQCLTKTVPERADWRDVQDSVVEEIVNFCNGYEIYLNPEVEPLSLKNTDKGLLGTLYVDPEAGEKKDKKDKKDKDKKGKKDDEKDKDNADKKTRKSRKDKKGDEEERKEKGEKKEKEEKRKSEDKDSSREKSSKKDVEDKNPSPKKEKVEVLKEPKAREEVVEVEALGSIGGEDIDGDIEEALESDLDSSSPK